MSTRRRDRECEKEQAQRRRTNWREPGGKSTDLTRRSAQIVKPKILHLLERDGLLLRPGELGTQSAEEAKTIPQIYDEEAAVSSAEPSTSGQFPFFREVRSAMYKQRAKRYPNFPEIVMILFQRLNLQERAFLLM
ncbi:hypothetical protein T02_5518 [Trichinella nativa]|uniref:Uncharacterized protein n=1 Tax=Trichinella nativa TaxID=6335 RepID=A0A0V1KYB1_9BILA|nr:hypothetical protein T02_5518 [Trichinella nativa]